MTVTIYVVTQHTHDYDCSSFELVMAFPDRARAQAMVSEYNARPTLAQVIQEKLNAVVDSLPDDYMSPPHPLGPRLVFDQARRDDPDYMRDYKAALKERRKVSRDYTKRVQQERQEHRNRQIIEFRDWLNSEMTRKSLARSRRLREERVSYRLDAVEYHDGATGEE